MNNDEAQKVGIMCRDSELWRWMPGMHGMDDLGNFVVEASGRVSVSAWPDLRHIGTQSKAFWLLKQRLPDFRPQWLDEWTWSTVGCVDTADGGRYQPIARTLPELLAAVFWRWPKSEEAKP